MTDALPGALPHPDAPAAPFLDDGNLFRMLVQGVTDYAIYMLDPDGIIRNWNTGGRLIKGYEDSEIIGQHFSRFYTEEDRNAGEPERGLLMARLNGRHEKEGWRLRKNGSRFWASVVIDSIWQGDRLIGFAKIARDITERHEAQLRLEQTQHALAQAQKIEAIGKLTLGLAHDFNNLLTVIANSLDLILIHRHDAARTHELVDSALHAAERGSLLTRQLLAFAQGQQLTPERTDLNKLLVKSRELFTRASGPLALFELELHEPLPEVLVDAAQFEAAVLNLIVNGRDAMPNGGRISIRTRLRQGPEDLPEAAGKIYVCVEICDTGTGMSMDILDRAVEPFFTTKEVGKGSGLGLSQVHGFASQSGGFVHLQSEPDKGTTATINLPVCEA